MATAATTRQSATHDEIVALEKSYWDAMKRKDGHGAAALSGNPSLVSGKNGVMAIPRTRMASMTEEGEWTLESYEFDDVQVAAPAPDVAIIAYTVTQQVTLQGKPQTMRAADCSTWVRGDDGWQCHAHSETMLEDRKPT